MTNGKTFSIGLTSPPNYNAMLKTQDPTKLRKYSKRLRKLICKLRKEQNMALQKLKEQINKFEKQFQEKMDKQIDK